MDKNAYDKYAANWPEGYTNVDYFVRCFTEHDGEECQIFDGIDKDQEINDCIAGLEIPVQVKDALAPVLYNWWNAYFSVTDEDCGKYWSPILQLAIPHITNQELWLHDYCTWQNIMFASADKLSFDQYVEEYQPEN